MALAETVVVGNNHLAGYARQFARRVCVIPTVVDLPRYPNQRRVDASETIQVVWIGTPLTTEYLKPLIPVMERLQSEHPRLSFRFIGAADGLLRNGLRAETVAWSEQKETGLLSECDIGIMPLRTRNLRVGMRVETNPHSTWRAGCRWWRRRWE